LKIEEGVLEKELEVFAAGDSAPVGPGAIDQVEEGDVGDAVRCMMLALRFDFILYIIGLGKTYTGSSATGALIGMPMIQ
jgi:hypothetical protein